MEIISDLGNHNLPINRTKVRKLIYLASPYTSSDKALMDIRFERVTLVSALLLERGLFNISPITLSHEQCKQHDLPTDWVFWRNIDLALLERCDELWVLADDGWEKSLGVQSEISAAMALNKPVRYITLNNGFLSDAEGGKLHG